MTPAYLTPSEEPYQAVPPSWGSVLSLFVVGPASRQSPSPPAAAHPPPGRLPVSRRKADAPRADSARASLLVRPPQPAEAAARSAGTTAAWAARGDQQGEGRHTRALRLRSPLPQPPLQPLEEWKTAGAHQDACLEPGTGPSREARAFLAKEAANALGGLGGGGGRRRQPVRSNQLPAWATWSSGKE